MNKTRDKVIDITIPAGEQLGSWRNSLDKGHVIGAELHTNHVDIDNLATIQLNDDSGAKVMSKTHINHWKKREGAGFIESLKPICLDTDNKTFEFIVSTKTPVAMETYVQVILIYKEQK